MSTMTQSINMQIKVADQVVETGSYVGIHVDMPTSSRQTKIIKFGNEEKTSSKNRFQITFHINNVVKVREDDPNDNESVKELFSGSANIISIREQNGNKTIEAIHVTNDPNGNWQKIDAPKSDFVEIILKNGTGGSRDNGKDEHGTQMLYKPTGKRVEMGEGSDHRNGKRYNVNHKFENYMMIGYFKTGKDQEKWKMKTDGPNHSHCNQLDECMWIEPQWNLSDGSFTLGGEWPHPDNHDIDKSKYKAEKPTGQINQQWIGTAVCAYWNKDGNRVCELWASKDPFEGDKPKNNWILGIKAIDSADNVILPSKKRPRKIPTDHNKGLEAEIRMHKGTEGDTEVKWCYVYEIEPQKA